MTWVSRSTQLPPAAKSTQLLFYGHKAAFNVGHKTQLLFCRHKARAIFVSTLTTAPNQLYFDYRETRPDIKLVWVSFTTIFSFFQRKDFKLQLQKHQQRTRVHFTNPKCNCAGTIGSLDQCFSTGGSRPTFGSKALTFGSPKPLLYHYDSFKRVANCQTLKTTGLDLKMVLIQFHQ